MRLIFRTPNVPIAAAVLVRLFFPVKPVFLSLSNKIIRLSDFVQGNMQGSDKLGSVSR